MKTQRKMQKSKCNKQSKEVFAAIMLLLFTGTWGHKATSVLQISHTFTTEKYKSDFPAGEEKWSVIIA